MKVLTIGGGTQDVFLRFEGADAMVITRKHIEESYMIFKSGTKIEVNELNYYTGGGATNSAVCFQRLGFQASCFCKTGSDTAGGEIRKQLESEGVDASLIISSDEHHSGRSLVINSRTGERTIFAYRGSNAFLHKNEIPLQAISQSNLLYITSLSGESALLLPDIVAEACKHNIPIAINPGSSQLTKGCKMLKKSLSAVDTFILNSIEARMFMISLIETDSYYKRTLECLKEDVLCPPDMFEHMPQLLRGPIPHENFFLNIRSFFKEILGLGAKTVVVTDGEHGVYVAQGNTITFCPSIKTEVVDTLGAGDAFGSCFVACKALGMSLNESLHAGMLNAVSVIGRYGAKAGLLTKKELLNQLAQTPPQALQTFML